MLSRLRGLWLIVLIAMTAAICLVSAPSASATQSLPPVFNKAYFFSTSCVTTDDCWAVGQEAGTGGVGLGLFVHWDGVTWTAVPGQAIGTSFVVHAVDCVAADDCWSVGWVTSPGSLLPATEHWDGTSWSLISSPQQSGVLLQSISCVATNDCWAVGQDEGSPDPSPSFVIHWDGTAWTKFASPPSALFVVDCVSSSFCLAGGNGANTLLDWNGTSWVVDPASVATIQQPSAGITAIDCNSASDCWSFAHDVRHWDGVSWTVSLSSDDWDASIGRSVTPYALDTASISCSASDDCWAVRLGDSSHLPASAHWDGLSWATTVLPAQSTVNQIEGIDCSTGSCVAVGLSSAGSADAQTYIATTDELAMPSFGFRAASFAAPSWRVVPTPKLWSWIDLPNAPVPSLASGGNSVPGQSVVYTAVLPAPAFRRGTMVFAENGVVFKRVAMALNATAATAAHIEKTTGDHVITATFVPVAPYLPTSAGEFTQHVVRASTATTITVTAGPKATSYTAHVHRVLPAKGIVTPGGSFTFYDGSTLVALVPASPVGSARIILLGAPRSLTVSYLGGPEDLAS